jgi:hypothetical protein
VRDSLSLSSLSQLHSPVRKENWPKDVWDFSVKALQVQNLEIHLTLTEIYVGIKGKPTHPLFKVSAANVKTRLSLSLSLTRAHAVAQGKLFNRINTDDSTWTWDKDTEVLEFTLQKDMTVHDAENSWWASLVQGHEKIDVDLIEGSKYLDVSLLRRIKAEKELKKKAELEAKQAAAAAADAAATATTASDASPAQ